jgi:hypothetical protein
MISTCGVPLFWQFGQKTSIFGSVYSFEIGFLVVFTRIFPIFGEMRFPMGWTPQTDGGGAFFIFLKIRRKPICTRVRRAVK